MSFRLFHSPTFQQTAVTPRKAARGKEQRERGIIKRVLIILHGLFLAVALFPPPPPIACKRKGKRKNSKQAPKTEDYPANYILSEATHSHGSTDRVARAHTHRHQAANYNYCQFH